MEHLLEILSNGDAVKELFQEIERLVAAEERRVIALPIETTSDRDLVLAKARSEGARRLFVALQGRLKTLTPKPERPRQ